MRFKWSKRIEQCRVFLVATILFSSLMAYTGGQHWTSFSDAEETRWVVTRGCFGLAKPENNDLQTGVETVSRSGFCLCKSRWIVAPVNCGHPIVGCSKVCRSENKEYEIWTEEEFRCPVVQKSSDPFETSCSNMDPPTYKNGVSHLQAELEVGSLLRVNNKVRHLYSLFYAAQLKHALRYTTPGDRRDPNDDYVQHGKRLSKFAVVHVKIGIQRFLAAAPKLPNNTFGGKGIVLVGGAGKPYRTSYWVAIYAIRRTKCTLPIEVWFPWGEQPDCKGMHRLQELGAQVRIFDHLLALKDAKNLSGYAFKLLALVFSSFEEVLLLDADNVVLRSPEYLFDSSIFREKGSLLWRDFWLQSRAPEIADIGALRLPGNFSHESGQMIVHKRKIWPALMLACYMNSHWSLFYPLSVNYMGLGDKEILPLALTYLGLSYGIINEGPDHIGVHTDRVVVFGNTMMQHDEEGKPIFLHANIGKWTTHMPKDFKRYIRRWQISLLHGKNITNVINERAGVDLEEWIHSLTVKNRCLFDPRPSAAWYEKLSHGPLLDGMYLTDHFNINTELRAFQKLVRLGYAFQ